MLFRHRRNPDHRRQRSLPPWRYRIAGLAAAALALSFLQANVGNAAAERAAAEAAPKAAADVVRVAEFLAECPYTHRAPDDPIVFPGLPGASHMHSYVGWVQLMTPMNQQAVKLLTLAAERAAEPRVRAFAVRLRTGHEAELNRLRPLLTRMGLPLTDVHAGHDMPGMVTEQDLEAAHAAEDPRSTGSSSRGSGTICASPRRCRVPRSPRAAGRTPVNWRAPS